MGKKGNRKRATSNADIEKKKSLHYHSSIHQSKTPPLSSKSSLLHPVILLQYLFVSPQAVLHHNYQYHYQYTHFTSNSFTTTTISFPTPLLILHYHILSYQLRQPFTTATATAVVTTVSTTFSMTTTTSTYYISAFPNI